MLPALPERLRAFVALQLDAAVEAAIADLIRELRKPDDGVAWIRSANIHLTLRFLGDAVPAAMLVPLDSALGEIAQATAAFCLHPRGTGAFPNLDRPRVLWIGLDGEPLIRLAEQVEAAARSCGFTPEPRPFAPHLTIGRVRDPRGWKRLRDEFARHADRRFGESPAETITLYRSILGRNGSTYEALAQYPLGRMPS